MPPIPLPTTSASYSIASATPAGSQAGELLRELAHVLRERLGAHRADRGHLHPLRVVAVLGEQVLGVGDERDDRAAQSGR